MTSVILVPSVLVTPPPRALQRHALGGGQLDVVTREVDGLGQHGETAWAVGGVSRHPRCASWSCGAGDDEGVTVAAVLTWEPWYALRARSTWSTIYPNHTIPTRWPKRTIVAIKTPCPRRTRR